MTFLDSLTCMKVEVCRNKINRVWKKFLNTRKIRSSNDWSWIPWWEPWVPKGSCPRSFVTSISSSKGSYSKRFTTTFNGFITFKGSTFAFRRSTFITRGTLPPSRGTLHLGGMLLPLRGPLPFKGSTFTSNRPPLPLGGHFHLYGVCYL